MMKIGGSMAVPAVRLMAVFIICCTDSEPKPLTTSITNTKTNCHQAARTGTPCSLSWVVFSP